MTESALLTTTTALLVAMCFLLTPMAPGGVIDTRDFSPLPRWQFNAFNVFLISLGLASLITAGFAVAGTSAAFLPALILAALYVAVFGLDLGQVFPVVPDRLPSQLIVLEAIDLALGGVLVVIAAQGLLL